MIVLDERLSLLKDLIGPVDTLYDVGSNHGHLPAFMLQNGLCRQACLSDISEKALLRAKKIFTKEKLLEQAHFVVTDGLQGLQPTNKDGIVISGMGAQLIGHILEKEAPQAPLVLQANLDLPYLRDFLFTNGYKIEKERICRAAGRFYVCIKAIYDQNTRKACEKDLYLGALQEDPLQNAYFAWRSQIAGKALHGAKKGRDQKSIEALEKELLFYEEYTHACR